MSEPVNVENVADSGQGNVIGNNSDLFIQAINDSRFVKGFGLTAFAYAFVSVFGLTLLGGGIGVGVGLFIMRYDPARYYRILGIVVIVFALIGTVVPFLGASVLSGAILGKGIQVMKVLSRVENKDEEWATGRKRTLIGTIASGAGLGLSIVLILLTIIGLLFMSVAAS